MFILVGCGANNDENNLDDQLNEQENTENQTEKFTPTKALPEGIPVYPGACLRMKFNLWAIVGSGCIKQLVVAKKLWSFLLIHFKNWDLRLIMILLLLIMKNFLLSRKII